MCDESDTLQIEERELISVAIELYRPPSLPTKHEWISLQMTASQLCLVPHREGSSRKVVLVWFVNEIELKKERNGRSVQLFVATGMKGAFCFYSVFFLTFYCPPSISPPNHAIQLSPPFSTPPPSPEGREINTLGTGGGRKEGEGLKKWNF